MVVVATRMVLGVVVRVKIKDDQRSLIFFRRYPGFTRADTGASHIVVVNAREGINISWSKLLSNRMLIKVHFR